MIYLDSSALLKLLFQERESAALEDWISERSDTPLISSELAKVEVIRATRRLSPGGVPAARTLLAEVDLLPVTGGVLEEAAALDGDVLRSLDAIHLASALSVKTDISAFIAYDHRLRAAAEAEGIEPIHPGA